MSCLLVIALNFSYNWRVMCVEGTCVAVMELLTMLCTGNICMARGSMSQRRGCCQRYVTGAHVTWTYVLIIDGYNIEACSAGIFYILNYRPS